MVQELTCQLHGPYPASYRSCPRCAKIPDGRPQDPGPIGASDDDLPTNYYEGSGRSVFQAGSNLDDAPTVLPGGMGAHGRILDMDEEETNLGFHRYGDDVTELDIPVMGPQAILWVKEGRRRGKIYPLKEETVLGRRTADLIIDDPKVSTTHAKIVLEDGEYVVIDFKSKNGTYVNGQRITAETRLKENDTIKIGEVVFVLKILDN
ncbi:MAG: FHA domain-containing protein [Chloroflexi bacterium]|jgi:hypothetical protein|nr:FHA domain-containing protein [Chloroflexota bacterium]